MGTVYKEASFGVPRSALSTVGYTVLTESGTTEAARTTTGVNEHPAGSGTYGASITLADGFSGTIAWDTGGGSPLTAYDEINIPASSGGGGGGGGGGSSSAALSDSAAFTDWVVIATTLHLTDSAHFTDSVSVATHSAASQQTWS
jgi:hypothetical protein